MKYNIESFFEAIKNDLYEIGFDYGEVFPENNTIDFFRDNKKYEISYICTDRNEKNQLLVGTTLHTLISLKEVNDILFQFVDNGNDYITVSSLPNYEFNEEFLEPLKNKYIKSAKDLLFVKEILLEYISKYALPFFSEIASVKDVNDKILEKVSWEKWSDYIPGRTYYKAIIILKLSNSKQYEAFYSMYYDRVKSFVESGRTDLIDFLNTLSNLKSYLDKKY